MREGIGEGEGEGKVPLSLFPRADKKGVRVIFRLEASILGRNVAVYRACLWDEGLFRTSNFECKSLVEIGALLLLAQTSISAVSFFVRQLHGRSLEIVESLKTRHPGHNVQN